MSNNKSQKSDIVVNDKATVMSRIKTSCRKILQPSSLPKITLSSTPSTPPSSHFSPSRPERKHDIEKVFKHMDENNDGKISPAELQRCVEAVGAQRLSLEEAEAAVECSDSDGDGLLSLEDFEQLIQGSELSEEEKTQELRYAFVLYSNKKDGSGVITAKSLKKMLIRLGDESWSDEDCMGMIRVYDADGDGVLCFDEFVLMMR